jgi:hypothetical protein
MEKQQNTYKLKENKAVCIKKGKAIPVRGCEGP